MDYFNRLAADLGLGTWWVAFFEVEATRDYLQIPAVAEPIVIISHGFPAGLPCEKVR